MSLCSLETVNCNTKQQLAANRETPQIERIDASSFYLISFSPFSHSAFSRSCSTGLDLSLQNFAHEDEERNLFEFICRLQVVSKKSKEIRYCALDWKLLMFVNLYRDERTKLNR